MNKLIACAFSTAILGLASGLQAASSVGAAALDRSLEDQKVSTPAVKTDGTKIKSEKEKPSEKSVPAPSALLLIGVAAGVVWGIRKMLPTRHAE